MVTDIHNSNRDTEDNSRIMEDNQVTNNLDMEDNSQDMADNNRTTVVTLVDIPNNNRVDSAGDTITVAAMEVEDLAVVRSTITTARNPAEWD